MDPTSTILSVFTGDATSRHEAVSALNAWYCLGGFHPTLKDIEEEADLRMLALPRTWKARAIRLGAIQ